MDNTPDNIIIDETIIKSPQFDCKKKSVLQYIEKYIKRLDNDALSQICNIIKVNGEKFTTKKDYVLINLGNLKKETILAILTFILFINKNKNILDQDENIKLQIKQQYSLETPEQQPR